MIKRNKDASKLAIEIDPLVLQCVKNNRKAQRLLFRKYHDTVYSIVVHNLGPKFEHDDVVQQAFIKIFVSLKSFKGLSSLNTWVYRITTKVCIDQLRKKYRKRQLEIINGSDILENKIDSRMDSPAIINEKKELKDHIQKALNKLAIEKRVVVTMFEIEGFSLQEISVIVNKPIGTVKSRLFHGRNELAKYLAKYLDVNKI